MERLGTTAAQASGDATQVPHTLTQRSPGSSDIRCATSSTGSLLLASPICRKVVAYAQQQVLRPTAPCQSNPHDLCRCV